MPLYTAMDMKYCLSEWMKDAFTSTFFLWGLKDKACGQLKDENCPETTEYDMHKLAINFRHLKCVINANMFI